MPLLGLRKDMGTEAGLSEFHTTDVRCCMPPWLGPAEIESDTDAMMDQAPSAPDGWASSWLLRNAIPVPGMMHIVTNLLLEVHAAMAHWDDMLSRLAELGKLLCPPQRRERFILTCVRGSSHACMERAVDKAYPQLYDKRWHSAMHFMRAINGILPVLQCCWDPAKYLRGHSGLDGTDDLLDDNFSVAAVTRAVRDKLLHGYMKMALLLDSTVAKLGAWSEGCRCHEDVLTTEKTAHRRKKRLKTLVQGTPARPRSVCASEAWVQLQF